MRDRSEPGEREKRLKDEATDLDTGNKDRNGPVR